MKKNIVLLVASLFLVECSLYGTNNQTNTNKRDVNVFVELEDSYGTSVDSRDLEEKEFLIKLKNNIGLNYRINDSYKSVANILNLSISSNDVETIKNISGVKLVSEVKKYELDNDIEDMSFDPYENTNKPDQNYSKVDMNVPSTSNGGTGTMIAIIDDSFNIDHEMFKDLSSGYKYTKSEITNFKNASGFNAKNAGYKDNKIPFYYSYATNDTTLSFTSNKDFHGAHVSGIAGANNTIEGIAPNSQLALMRVTNARGVFDENAVVKALDDCAKLDVDAINMSFGNSLLDYTINDAIKSCLENLKTLGIDVNVAAGNDGRRNFNNGVGEYSSTSNVETGEIGSYASQNSVVSVGALDIDEDVTINSSFASYSGTTFYARDQIVNHAINKDGVGTEEKYDDIKPFYEFIKDGDDNVTLDYVVVPNLGNDEDYKDIDVNGKIAVISRGTITFVLKIRNAVKHGAKGVIIYNNKDNTSSLDNTYIDFSGNNDPLEDEYYVPIALTSSAAGELLINQETKKIIVGKEKSADYSSDGGTSDLSLKPDISAPGTHVYSGTSTIDGVNNYSFLNGTSMATPNMTGAYANILSNYTGDDSEAYKRNLVARMQSTANPIKDVNGSYYSPRKVGAGEVDVGGAINSDVYLIGNVDNRAKIELKNNEDIKKGDVKLSVETHNGSSESKKYKATVYVQAPELTGVDNTLTNITNYKVKTDKDVLLTSSTSEVTIPAGTSNLSFNVSITNDNKEYLKNFENGTYLEGYVVFDSLDNSEDLSIPYLGFYGDYNKEEAVEPFAFEKDENKLYGSEIINTMCDVYPALNPLYKNADFSSIFAVGSKALTSSEITSIRSNESNLLNYMNQVSYSKKKNKINLGIDGISTHVVIQQFINRNLIDNSVNLINTKTGKVVYSKYLYSLLDGDTGSSLTKHALTKSMMTSDLFSYGIIANRGFLVLDLVDDSNNLIYPEGDYTLEFNYTLVNGSTSKKSYNVTISKTLVTEKPMFYKKEILTIEDKKYLRVYFSAEEIKEVKIEDETIDYSTDGNSYYVDIDVSKYESQKSVRLSIVDIYNKTLDGLLQMTSIDSGMYAIFQESLPEGSRMSASISDPVDDDSGNRTYNYSFVVIDSGNMPVSFDDTTKLSFAVPSDVVVDSSNIAVYEVSDAGIENQIPFSLYEKNIVVETKSSNLKVVYKAVEKETNIFTKPGVIIGISVGVAALAIGAVVMIIVVNKLKKKEVK
ncbi:MAG: S8 family serine peptidase [Bacilli bacterium]